MNNNQTTFKNSDGTGTVIVRKDEDTGKYEVLTSGDIKVNLNEATESGKGIVYIRGDLETAITVDGDLRVDGNINAPVIASGNVSCSGKVYDETKIEQNSILDEESYDIRVLNGTLEFTGNVCNNKTRDYGLYTDHRVNVDSLARVKLNRDLSIVTDDDIALYHNGDMFELLLNTRLYVNSSNLGGRGIVLNCSGDIRTFTLNMGSEVQVYGTNIGIEVGGDSSFFVEGDGQLEVVAKGTGIENRGQFCAYEDSWISAIGDKTGIANRGPNAKFYIYDNAFVDVYGEDTGVLNNATFSYSVQNGYDVKHHGIFEIDCGGELKTNSVVTSGMNVYDEKTGERKSAPLFVVDGVLVIDSVGTEIPEYKKGIHDVTGSGKVIYNDRLIYEGDPEDEEDLYDGDLEEEEPANEKVENPSIKLEHQIEEFTKSLSQLRNKIEIKYKELGFTDD